MNFELGDPYIYVDGTCRYWVATWSNDPFNSWRPIHTGTLSETDLKPLADSIHYDDMPAFVRTCEPSHLDDGGYIHLYDGEHLTGCTNGTPTLKAAELSWFDICQKLYSAGQPVESALRVTVGPAYAKFSPLYKWPLMTPMQDFFVSEQDSHAPGRSKRLLDPGEVAKLLLLREQYLHDPAQNPGIELEGGYVLYFREDLPFTGEDGLPTFVHAP